MATKGKKTTEPKDAVGLTLPQQMKAIIEMAKQNNVDKNFFFITTFKRYQMQIKILKDLEKVIKTEDVLVSKEYVKGRSNIYSHPAIKDYNRTTDSANKTAALLLKITNLFRKHPVGEDDDPLLKILADDGEFVPELDEDESED